MADDKTGPSAPIVSVRPGRNRLAEEDRALLEARRRLHGQQHRHGEAGAGGAGHEGGYGHGHASGDFQDDISVLGIPHAEMTENVRRAIDLLFEEIHHLREELMRAHGHEAYLEEQAEKDRLLHVMRRRAFLARLNLAARRVAEERAQFTLVYVAIANAAAVRAEFGHGALESLMMHASEAMREGAEPGDVVGSLEQFDFGVLLPGTPPAAAEAKAQTLLGALAARAFTWQGQSLAARATFGVAEVAPSETGEETIDRAKRDRDARGPGAGA